MKVKLLEVRDEGAFIAMLCIDMNPSDSIFSLLGMSPAEYEKRRYLLRRCGYLCNGRPNIAITSLDAGGDRCSNDPYFWGDRTRKTAHEYIIQNWEKLQDGDVVDVEFILGETEAPKKSERETSAITTEAAD